LKPEDRPWSLVVGRRQKPTTSEQQLETADFVSTLGLEPEPFHTVVDRQLSVVGKKPRTSSQQSKRRTHLTGTFNLFVKDRNRIPPERRAFRPEQIAHECASVCPRNLLKLQPSSRCCQPTGIT